MWIQLLYRHPTAKVLINGHLASAFSITMGTRQGCPLSPLLFALAIEPLAAKLRQHHQDQALRCQLRQILISLYADDVTLYIRDPQHNLNPLLREFVVFGQITGIHINWGKSHIFLLTEATSLFPLDFPLEWCDSELRYLGIHITRDKDELMRLNYGVALERITNCVTRWIALPISMAGRASLIKMVILPQLLYLFLNIPYHPGGQFFKMLRSEMIRLVWGGKQPRLQWDILT